MDWSSLWLGFVIGGAVALGLAATRWAKDDDGTVSHLALIGGWLGGIGPILGGVVVGIGALLTQ